jgi:hypothetical protein
MPLLPAQTFSHSSSTTSPSEVTTPIPVMTTRRLVMRFAICNLQFAIGNAIRFSIANRKSAIANHLF